MVINRELMDKLSAQAKASTQKRVHFDLRNSGEDKSQRMLNVLEPGTVIPIHRHRNTNEILCLLRGSIIEYLYDDNGVRTDSFTLKAGSDSAALLIPAGVWHEPKCLEEGTVLLTVKDGPYKELGDIDKLQVKYASPSHCK